MPALSRAEILARKLHGDTDRVPFPKGSDTYLVVRGLTRGEAQQTVGKDVRDVEAMIVHFGLVEPADMSLDDVLAWMDNDQTGQFEPVIKRINQMSGNEEGQGKEYTKSVSGQ